ncbi:aryl-sulfate sulfotransferase [Haloarcula nitratireducens]|uniref:Arylsulfotransferase family protein n=1 Tax=Haloarcula nitratireducens TaxID=2487749 RepID=A0AAW4PGZ4_9EURY|nr:aryl-sulfate sulfotransferase [Halomicroarcula nitratireducens]MBX0297188.1 arylsulfotransferase family protein [Halomicroarcula nitratireducens]
MTDSRRLSAGLAVLTLLFALLLATSYASAQLSNDEIRGDPAVERALQTGERDPVVGPRDNLTVVATDSTAFTSDQGDSARKRAELVAFAPDGSIYYANDSHTRYWDVDPVPGTNATVEYVYAQHLTPEQCDAETVCTRNGVERVNMTTGEVTSVYSRITPGKHSTRWHDVDRISEDRLLVADIDRDRAYVVNTTTELVEWSWDAQADYNTSSGGPYPSDWTHLNDVEYVEIDGRPTVMASLRNQDQVVFIDMERGLREDWTLGEDGDHDTLYEQHNPDFIPAERGGPAVLVADSENGRVVEYQREDGEWVQSWKWKDSRLTWVRDADRLPNGHTLMADSNGDRVLEVDESGEVVWSADIGFPYEAERFGTGDESAGGQSAAALGLPDRTPNASDRGSVGRVKAAAPQKVVNGVAYLMPGWMGTLDALAVLGLLVTVPLLLIVEWRRRDLAVSVRSPLQFRRR